MAELPGPPAARAVHLVGVGGAGMSGLAKLLARLGYRVSGSDLKPGRFLEALADEDVATWLGHRPQQAAGWDLVVASSAVPDTDPELRAAVAAGVEIWRRPELLEALTGLMPAIGFSGTHGKTTSTALAVAALHGAGHDPTFMVGGELVGLNTNAHLGDTGLFVLEADEAYGTFQLLHLRGLLVTNVEPDHMDHYATFGRLEDAFVDVAERTAGPVIVGIDDPGARRLARRVGARTYGTNPDADWLMTRVRMEGGRTGFRLRGPAADVEVSVPRPGLHIARNAAGVLALLAESGIDPHAAAAGIAGFAGVRRRFEVRARLGGVTVVDDYAHHPTEVAATLAAARLGAWERVWAVFQPHRYTRTAELAVPLGGALAAGDIVVVDDVYGAGEPPQPGITGNLVADAAAAAGAHDVTYLPGVHAIAGHLAARVRPGDLVVLMGAGDITAAGDELAFLLGERR